MSRLRACWVSQAPVGWAGDAEDVHPAGGVLDDEEHVEAVQGDRVEMKQVAGKDAVCLGAEELRPSRTGPPRRGIDPGRMKDLPHGGGADLIAEPGQLPVHASIPPRGVLGGQPDDQGADSCGYGGAACPDGPGCPVTADELPVPAQDCWRCDQESAAATGR
jgi:hypothetical protein